MSKEKNKKPAGKEIVVRERMEATQVLPPEASAPKSASVTIACQSARVTLDKNADPVGVARVVSERWDRAQAGLFEILYFGATLLEVQAWVEEFNLQQRINSPKAEGPGRPGGTGLKGWLEKNCPSINYKTAYGYMCAASGLRREAKLADDVPLLAMMGMDAIPEARAEKLRQRVQRILADSTLGLLREAASAAQEPVAKGGQREGAGRPKLEPSADTRAGAAWGLIGREIDRATAWHFERFLPEAITREALSTVALLKEALEARMKEF